MASKQSVSRQFASSCLSEPEQEPPITHRSMRNLSTASACFVQARHRRVQVIYSRDLPNVLLTSLAVLLVLLPSGSETRTCHSLAVIDMYLLVCLVPNHIVAYLQVVESLAIDCLVPQLQNQ